MYKIFHKNTLLSQFVKIYLIVSVLMLSITTGQFVICITNGHIAIELNGTSDCEQSCDNPVDEQKDRSTDTKSCSHCIDTVVTLNEIFKSKDDVNRCGKCIISNLISIQTDEITENKIANSYFYLHNYKNFFQSQNQNISETTVLLI